MDVRKELIWKREMYDSKRRYSDLDKLYEKASMN